MLKGFTKSELELIIDHHLTEMFNPKITVPSSTKEQIKKQVLQLLTYFIKIIETFNSSDDSEKAVDYIIHLIDEFIDYLESYLRNEPNKLIASSVGLIYHSLFIEAQVGLKDNLLDKMYFDYGEQGINKILMERLKK